MAIVEKRTILEVERPRRLKPAAQGGSGRSEVTASMIS
jgi:hypothetical protein